jgi:iron(III) transport system permease protein
MLPGLLAGSGLVLLSAMKELPATLLLAPAGWGTLATEIWTATESALFADASIAALLLIALSGVLTWALVIRRSDSLV